MDRSLTVPLYSSIYYTVNPRDLKLNFAFTFGDRPKSTSYRVSLRKCQPERKCLLSHHCDITRDVRAQSHDVMGDERPESHRGIGTLAFLTDKLYIIAYRV